jgi:hypothetical protein
VLRAKAKPNYFCRTCPAAERVDVLAAVVTAQVALVVDCAEAKVAELEELQFSGVTDHMIGGPAILATRSPTIIHL